MGDNSSKTQRIASRSRTARESAGLSQAQAAKKLGIPRTALTEAEAGNRKISATEIADMARIYGVGVGWLTEEAIAPDPDGDRIQLAARELARLRKEDLETVLQLVRSIRSKPKGGQP
jgi:transcriptional regulator with XRE-family HTH domain